MQGLLQSRIRCHQVRVLPLEHHIETPYAVGQHDARTAQLLFHESVCSKTLKRCVVDHAPDGNRGVGLIDRLEEAVDGDLRQRCGTTFARNDRARRSEQVADRMLDSHYYVSRIESQQPSEQRGVEARSHAFLPQHLVAHILVELLQVGEEASLADFERGRIVCHSVVYPCRPVARARFDSPPEVILVSGLPISGQR